MRSFSLLTRAAENRLMGIECPCGGLVRSLHEDDPRMLEVLEPGDVHQEGL